MASLGRTYIFMPSKAPATAIPKNIAMVIKIGMALDLDFHDLLHDEVADDLQRHGRAQHDVADVVGEEELDVVRIGVKHQNRNGDRNQAERGGGHAAVRADCADASAELEALADHIGQLVQNLSQVDARTLLQQHCRDEEVDIERRYALGQLLQSYLDGQSQVVFFESPPELARHGLLKLTVNHFERYRKSVPGAHGSRDEFECFRKDFLETLEAGFALPPDVDRGTHGGGQTDEDGQRLRNGQHQPGERGSTDERHQRQMHKSGRRPGKASLLQEQAEFGRQLVFIDQHLRQPVPGGVSLLEDLCFDFPFALSLRGSGAAEEAGLDRIYIG